MGEQPQSFDFFVSGIEDGIIAALKSSLPYVKEITSYSGDMDSERTVREALARMANRLPGIFVCYAAGSDEPSPAVAPLVNTPNAVSVGAAQSYGQVVARYSAPVVYRHDCSFVVIAVSGDVRGDQARRRGAGGVPGLYAMIADIKNTLDGIQFSVDLPSDAGRVLLTGEPLRPEAADYLARLPEISAYAVWYGTWFRYATADRSTALPLVQEVLVEVDNTWQKGQPPNRPGVTLE